VSTFSQKSRIGQHRSFRISDIIVENDQTKTFVLDGSLPEAHPGQYVMAWLPDIGEKPFSIAGNAPLTITIVSVGPFSAAMHSLKVDDRIWIRGSLGKGFHFEPQQQLLLAAGGYGVAPLLFLAKEAIKANCRMDLCVGSRNADALLLVDQFEKLGVSVYITTDDGSAGEKGLVTEVVEKVIQTKQPDQVFACGPVKMLEAIAALCQSHHTGYQLSWEAVMRCGMGICGCCEVQSLHIPEEGWLACHDGPVHIYSL
jgi:dihydroorotate dehydrogenase electron transfer subunit